MYYILFFMVKKCYLKYNQGHPISAVVSVLSSRMLVSRIPFGQHSRRMASAQSNGFIQHQRE